MAAKLISIIIAAGNAERFIGEALESVRTQTYQRWEIILTNDAGTDGTSRIASEFAQTVSQNVLILQHVRNQGPSAARNTGMKTAKGEYFAFLDADDFWAPEHLNCLNSVLESGLADLAYSDPFVFQNTPSGEIELLPIDTIEIKNPATDLFRRNFINTSGAAITRRLMEKVGDFDQTICGVEDLDYWIRAAAEGFHIASTGKQTYYYRKLTGSLSADAARMAEGGARLLEKHRHCGILPEDELVAKAQDCFFSAGKLYWRHDAAAASRNFYRSWSFDRRRPMPLLWFFFAFGLSLTRRNQRNGSRG